jgi:hypothetical protein
VSGPGPGYNSLVSQHRMETGGLGVYSPPQGDLSQSGDGLEVGSHERRTSGSGVVGPNPPGPPRVLRRPRIDTG